MSVIIKSRLNFLLFLAAFILTFFDCPLLSARSISRKDLFRKATDEFNLGNYQEALKLFKEFTNRYPEDKRVFLAFLYLGKIYYKQGNLPRAEDILLKIPTSQKTAEVYYLLGDIFLKLNDYILALSSSGMVKDFFPKSSFYYPALLVRAKAYYFLKNYFKAEKEAKFIIKNSRDKELQEEAYFLLFDTYYLKEDFSCLAEAIKNYLKNFEVINKKIYFYQSKVFLKQGDYLKALTLIKQGLESNLPPPSHLKVYKDIATIYILHREFQEADKYITSYSLSGEEFLQDALEFFNNGDYRQSLAIFNYFIYQSQKRKIFDRNLALLYLNKANVFYELGRFNDALSLYQSIIDNKKFNIYPEIIARAYFAAAQCYIKNNQFKKGIESLNYVLKIINTKDQSLSDNNQILFDAKLQLADLYHRLKDYSRANYFYDQLLKSSNISFSEVKYIFLKKIVSFIEEAKYSQGLLFIKEFTKKYPQMASLPKVKYYQGLCYVFLKDYPRAVATFKDLFLSENSLKNKNLLNQAKYLYGHSFLELGKYRDALPFLEEAYENLEADDYREMINFDLIIAYLKEGDIQNAKKYLDKMLSDFPYSRYLPRTLKGMAEYFYQQEDFSQSKLYYQQIIKKFPYQKIFYQASLALGRIFLREQNFEKAKEYFNFTEDCPYKEYFSLGKLYLAQIYEITNNWQKSLAIYEKLSKNKDFTGEIALLNKALLFKKNLRYKEATETFLLFFSRGEEIVGARFNYALCLEKLNRYSEALKQYYRILKYPSDDNYFKKINSLLNKELIIYLTNSKEKNFFNPDTYKKKSYLKIGRIYEKEGNYQKARQIYLKLFKYSPEEAKIALQRLKEKYF